MQYFLGALALAIVLVLIRRQIPIRRIPCVEISSVSNTDKGVILDIRSYNTADNSHFNIPYPYLHRYHDEIPFTELYLISSNRAERNLALRFLTAKGHKVAGYIYSKCPCKK
jgi:hypothetical protein